MRIFARTFVWLMPVLALVLVLTAATYKLSEAPAIWYDEGFYTQVAQNLAQYGAQGLQIAPSTFIPTTYVTVGYPLLLPVSLAYQYFGVGVLQGRAVMVAFIFAFAVAAYFFIRKLYGEWYAGWSALLLASFPVLYGDGKSVLGELPGVFFLVLCFIALLWLERSSYQSKGAYSAAGLAAGLCVVTKPIFILLLPALALVWLLRRNSIKVNWKGVAAAALLFVLPVVLWVHMQFGTDQSFATIFNFYAASPYAVDDRLALAVRNILQFFTESAPIYTAITMLFWSVSLYIRKRKSVHIYTAELVALFFCVAILVAYLRIQGWYRYFFPAQIIALLFLPYSLTTVFDVVRSKISVLQKFSWVPYVVIVLLVMGQLYQLARSSYVAGYYQSHNTSELAAAFESLPKESSYFLYNVPELGIFIPTRNYYQYIDATPKVQIGGGEVALLAQGVPQYVLVTSETHTQKPDLFAKYDLLKVVGRYDFLMYH